MIKIVSNENTFKTLFVHIFCTKYYVTHIKIFKVKVYKKKTLNIQSGHLIWDGGSIHEFFVFEAWLEKSLIEFLCLKVTMIDAFSYRNSRKMNRGSMNDASWSCILRLGIVIVNICTSVKHVGCFHLEVSHWFATKISSPRHKS